MSRIVLHTFGSLGDLHPYLALADALRRRGHDAVLATHGAYGPEIAAAGLAHVPVRPDLGEFGDLDRVLRRSMDLRTGSEYVLRELVLRHLRASTADLLEATARADLLVTHPLSLAGVLAAEKRGTLRVHAALQPFTMFSASDPPLMPNVPGSAWLRELPAPAVRAFYRLAAAATLRWFDPVRDVRRELGLPASGAHPLLEMWSPSLNLALFSPLFGPPQPDWPPHTVATGFLEWPSTAGWDARLQAFLDAGEPPVVFTLGSSAVHDAGGFYAEAAAAAAEVGARAVFLTGLDGRNPLPAIADDPRMLALAYAPHGRLFPRAAVVVHQGGIGTTARALAAGRPMLVVPHSHDQPDNARRCVALGVGRMLGRERFRAPRVARALRELLREGRTAERARVVAGRLARERGPDTAADAIEACLRGA